MKIIKERKEFQISIKDLIFVTSERRFFDSKIPLRIRASKGTEVHQIFQKNREVTESSFQREKMVKFKYKLRPDGGWAAMNIDCEKLTSQDTPVVFDIKAKAESDLEIVGGNIEIINKEIQEIRDKISTTEYLNILQPPSAKQRPVKPNVKLNAFLATIVGFIVMCLLCFLLEGIRKIKAEK